MAHCWNFGLFIFVLLSCVGNIENSKLNVPRVLLPIFKQFSSNFTLEVTESGCYKWSSSRVDVVQVTPINMDKELDCSIHAIVSAVSKDNTRNTAIILAEEVHSGQVLRCDVIVDVIVSMNIVTTTRELFMEEAPEAFEVRAYDDQGNEFTTLEGVEFQWSLGNWNAKADYTGGTSSNSVLRFITFRDSPYETPSTVEAFEQKGLRGHMVLLEGIKTGSAKVSVRLPHPEYAHVKPIEVQLMVVANLIIDPPDAYMLRGDSVHYRILQVQDGKLVEIPMPSQQYYLDLEDSSVAQIDAATGMATGGKIGKTKVLLHDRNVDEQEGGIRVPTAQLTVVDPAYLTLAILPNRNWAVMISEHYELVVEIYDSADHKLHIGAGVNVQAVIPETYFHVRSSTPNNTHHYGWPVRAGITQIHATLESVLDPVSGRLHAFTPKISAQADMTVFERIAVRPPVVVLPWDPTVKPKYEVPLNATGGDGTYLWGSSNSSVAGVTQCGLVKTHSIGSVEISAAMARNSHNRELAHVYVLPPKHLEIVEYVLEAEIGVPIHLHVALFADRPINAGGDKQLSLIPFTRCGDLPFRVDFSEKNFEYDPSIRAEPVGIACAALAIVGKSIGTTKVTVSYAYDGRVMENSITVATYQPLSALHPASGETVLAVGSSRMIVFGGGPRPWLGRPSEHVRQVDLGVEGEKAIAAREVVPDQADVYVYNVLCRKVGQVDMQLTVTNTPALKHCKRAESSATVRVICANPRYISIRPELKIAKPENCPMNLNAERIVAQSYKDVELTITVKDKLGRKFDNISSLFINWEVSCPSLAEVYDKGRTISDDLVDGNLVLPYRQYQKIVPKGKTGTVDVTATVVGYQTGQLKQLKIETEYPPFKVMNDQGYEATPEIRASVTLILVNDTVVAPNRTTLFNHPKNRAVLQVSQGSGFYEFVLSSDDIADVKYTEGTRTIEVRPRGDGVLKLALVDLCLVSKPAMVEVQVIAVGSIQIDAPDRVEKGKCMTVVVRLFDTMDNLIAFPDPALLELRALPESGIIGIKQQYPDKDAQPDREMRFTVTGIELGDTSLAFAAGLGAREVRSPSAAIQVFPPLRLFPRNVTLVGGAIFQVTSRGGPQPDANIEYTMGGPIASATRAGLVEGLKQGHTTLTGRAVGLNTISGQRVVYSQDTIDIHVVPLKGVKIHAPIARLRTGATMPVWASGVPDQITPLMLGSARSPLTFKWSLASRDVGVLRNVFHESGIEIADEDKISMRFTALKPGRTVIMLNVTCPGAMVCPKAKRCFQDSLEVEVFDELRLTRPLSATGPQSPSILIAPGTSVQLRTNRESASQHGFTLLDSGAVGMSPAERGAQMALGPAAPVVKVDSHGLVTALGPHGRSVVVVTASEEFGLKQGLSVTIEVKPISYMMLSVRSSLQAVASKSSRVHGLPQGLEVELTTSFHDNTGALFTSSRSDLKLRTNRFDVMQLTRGVDNGTVFARLLHSGKTMLKVWDDVTLQHVADYVKITSEDVIFPDKVPLTVGDVVCFAMALQPPSDSRHHCYWSTDNEAVLRVDPDSGIGMTAASGSVAVRYHYSATSLINSDLDVQPIESVQFFLFGNASVSNGRRDRPFHVPLVLRGEGDEGKKRNLVTGRAGSKCHGNKTFSAFPFSCRLSFSCGSNALEILAAYPAFNFTTGQYACDIISAGPATLETSTIRGSLRLEAEANGVTSPPLSLPYYPAVYLHDLEVYLTAPLLTASLSVSGLPEVLARVQVTGGGNVIAVGKPEKRGTTTMVYPVQLNRAQYMRSPPGGEHSLRIVSELTHQIIRVPVKVQVLSAEGGTDSAPCLATGVNEWGGTVGDVVGYYKHTFLVMMSVIVIGVASVYMYNKWMVQIGERPPPASLQLPSSPFNSSGPSSLGSNVSHRSPYETTQPPVYGSPHRLSYQTPPRR